MTSPIAERLRRWPAKEDAHVGVSELMQEAAAEIDALRLALAGAEERAKTAERGHMIVEREACARAEDVGRLEARCAELEKKIDIDEKRFTLAWDALDAAITYLRKEETCNHQLISYLNSAKHGVSGRSAIAPAPGEGESK